MAVQRTATDVINIYYRAEDCPSATTGSPSKVRETISEHGICATRATLTQLSAIAQTKWFRDISDLEHHRDELFAARLPVLQ